MGKLLCIDPGKKRIGVAISDKNKKIAFPYKIIESKDRASLVKELKEIITANDVEKVIIGYSKNSEGKPSYAALLGEKIGDDIDKETGIDIEYVDEEYSTQNAEEMFIRVGLSRKKRKEKIDKIAATLILKEYIEKNLRHS
ncbi:MAG: Holliday junction resolvase RuvX [Candidatus Hydrogenedentota bacterium]